MHFRPFGVRKINKEWLKIKAGLEGGLESQYKLSVIEADSLLDDILNRMGFTGETLGERLEKLTIATIPNLDEVLQAHHTRNNVVHDPDYILTLEEAKKAKGLANKVKAIVYADDKGGQFAWKVLANGLIYAANRIPEIADTILEIDNSMKWGYNFEMGPFEAWDAYGVAEAVERMKLEKLIVMWLILTSRLFVPSSIYR